MKIIFTVAGTLMFSIAFSQGFRVDLKVPQFDSGKAYLTYYYGANMNIQDSGIIDKTGSVAFVGKDSLPAGVYSIVFPGKRFFYDFLVGREQKIEIQAKDTLDLIGTTTVTGSKENELFSKYQKFIAEKSVALQREREEYLKARTRQDSALHEENYRKLNKELNDYRESVIKQNPSAMLAALFLSMKEPATLYPVPKTAKDSLENYQYYKSHYWEYITFRDDRIIRTPFFLPKLERYFRQVISPDADSIIKEADYLLLLSRTSPAMYRFLLNWFTDEYYAPKYMGQDKVLVHLFEKYHSKGVSYWLNEKQLKSISERAYMVMGNLIGQPAGEMTMTDGNGKVTSLYNIKSKFTVVCFWDPTCGHCQKELPLLDSFYQAKWKKEGVKVFTVLTDNANMNSWKKFIEKHHLDEWANVYESEEQALAVQKAGKPSYRQLYDVIETPTVFLLDSQKRIIAKKLTLAQLDDVIAARLKSNPVQ